MSTTPKAGYLVVPTSADPQTFACPECEGGGFGCECFIEALRFARSHEGGSTITRGSVVLATPGVALEAKARAEDRERRRRERRERLLGGTPDLPGACEGLTAIDTPVQGGLSSDAA